MSDNWIVQNIQNALDTWNSKLADIWNLVTQTPETFKGGAIWNVIKTIHGGINDNWIYVQDPSVTMGRIQIFNNWSPYMVKSPKNTIWMGLEYFCSEGDEFWNMSDKELKKFAHEELKKMKFIDCDILDSCVIKVKKAYPAYFDTYDQIDKVIKYLDRFENLYCIGRNGQHRYNNMDHSMMTAFETVDVITGKNNDKSIIWKVNTEKEYHEEKTK